MKKVLIFRSEFLSLSETFIRAQVMGLKNWEPHVACYRRVSPGLDVGDAEVSVLRTTRPSLDERVRWRAFRAFGVLVPRPVAALRNDGLRVVHVHFGVDAVLAFPVLRYLALPTLVTLHGYDATVREDWWRSGAGGKDMKLYPGSLRLLATTTNTRFIAVSSAIKEAAVRNLGLDGERVEVVHIGVDVERFRPTGVDVGSRKRKVLFVGRMVEKKAPEALVEALAVVQTRIPDVEAVFVGDGPLLGKAKERAMQLGVRARFMGAQGNSFVAQELAEARVFCLPSVVAANGDSEGLPISVLEAQACGVPVVTSAVGARDEGILEGSSGFAVREGDIGMLADRLSRVLGNDSEASRMGNSAREFAVRQFDSRRCVERLEEVYAQAAERPYWG